MSKGKPRVRLADIPAHVKRTSAFRECSSTAWGEVPPTGDSSIYLGNRGEKLVVDTHQVTMFRRFPRIGEGFHPVIASLML